MRTPRWPGPSAPTETAARPCASPITSPRWVPHCRGERLRGAQPPTDLHLVTDKDQVPFAVARAGTGLDEHVAVGVVAKRPVAGALERLHDRFVTSAVSR